MGEREFHWIPFWSVKKILHSNNDNDNDNNDNVERQDEKVS